MCFSTPNVKVSCHTFPFKPILGSKIVSSCWQLDKSVNNEKIPRTPAINIRVRGRCDCHLCNSLWSYLIFLVSHWEQFMVLPWFPTRTTPRVRAFLRSQVHTTCSCMYILYIYIYMYVYIYIRVYIYIYIYIYIFVNICMYAHIRTYNIDDICSRPQNNT